MFYIVETEEQLTSLDPTGNCFIDLIVKSDEVHPLLTTPSLIYYNNFDKGYVIVIDHSEGFSLQLDQVEAFLQKHKKVYLLNSKKHSYYFNLPNSIDVLFSALNVDGSLKELACDTIVHKDFTYKHRYSPNINCLIPICKHYEKSECLFQMVEQYIGVEVNLKWHDKYTEVYKWVEEQGITINEKLFDKYYEPSWKIRSIRDGKIYTSYNLYNVTSRPTNAFNGINFLALPKDKSRGAFIPTNDFFADFDFDGYHIRLIASLLKIDLPTDQSVHEMLGKEYFGKEHLTEEEYQLSKQITFRQLYNGVEDDYKDVILFKCIDEFIQTMWQTYEQVGYISLPNGRKLIQDNANPQKLFNYFIQCLETVNNVKKLDLLKQYLEGKKSKVVLVVYDSILVDFSKEDGMATYEGIKAILEQDNYVVKVKIGNSYDFR